ncbi:hypothetical protein [Rhizobium changzhiense]|uniref:Uncharacterized protein n=1 Tax=Rhizobium changzhiense TaxID=2692317 RepID=A0ABR6A2S2_9HYPH|nr:hypothetical protein [Rhizobium changzhiense]MBA5800907.1 hypothetical protein [Rhizobium changzhiense]
MRTELQEDLVGALSDSVESGVGRLVVGDVFVLAHPYRFRPHPNYGVVIGEIADFRAMLSVVSIATTIGLSLRTRGRRMQRAGSSHVGTT